MKGFDKPKFLSLLLVFTIFTLQETNLYAQHHMMNKRAYPARDREGLGQSPSLLRYRPAFPTHESAQPCEIDLIQIPAVGVGPFRRLQNLGHAEEPGVIDQIAKACQADVTFADVLMAVNATAEVPF